MAAPLILRGFNWDKQTPEQLSCQVDFAGSSPQKSGFLVDIWSLTVAEVHAHNERSGGLFIPNTKYKVQHVFSRVRGAWLRYRLRTGPYLVGTYE
jgi:hypothetical protein